MAVGGQREARSVQGTFTRTVPGADYRLITE